MSTWQCAECDTNNVMSDRECEVCGGTEHKKAAQPKPKPAQAVPQVTTKITRPAGPPPPVIPPATPVRPVTRPTVVTPAAFAPAPPPPPSAPTVRAKRPSAVPPPMSRPPAPAAYRRPSRRKFWTRRHKKVARWTGIGLAVLIFGPSLAEQLRTIETRSSGSTAAPGTTCPAATASWLPGGGSGATLVAAYQTNKHVITLCRATGGQVYYDGQVKGKPADTDHHINLPATSTGAGWVARNGVYTYTIANGTVTVAKSGTVVLNEMLQSA